MTRELIKYTGNEHANIDYHHGQLKKVVGVQSYQVLRANRSHPELSDGYGWTYNHAPMLAYWKDKFYLEYLSNPISEHTPPGQTLLVTSDNGVNWSKPKVVFPTYSFPIKYYQGSEKEKLNKESNFSVMHQRMGFYVASNGKLLVLAFYGICPSPHSSPNDGSGIGRVVREVYKGGSFGPIYFIRYNRHAGWNEENTEYPYYKEAKDGSFIEACEDLLSNKLATLQWWEEDRSNDGFYTIKGEKAFSYYHLPNGEVVGLWKRSLVAVSADEGESWSEIQKVPSLEMEGAKVWGQKISDGSYVLIYNPSRNNCHRWPLAIISGDGLNFDNLLTVVGEVAPCKYRGYSKDFGLNYVRGIVEGNGQPPDGDLWVTYSMNKEDIWVSRVPVPIRGHISEDVNDNFNDISINGPVTNWNIYSPKWAEVSVVEIPSTKNKSLKLSDKDPYDYAKAERIFPESKRVSISMKVLAKQTDYGQLQIETADSKGIVPARIVFDSDGYLKVKHGNTSGGLKDIRRYEDNKWYEIELMVDSINHEFTLRLDNEEINTYSFFNSVTAVERLTLRTGNIRKKPDVDTVRNEQNDLPDSGEPVKEAIYLINFVKVKKV